MIIVGSRVVSRRRPPYPVSPRCRKLTRGKVPENSDFRVTLRPFLTRSLAHGVFYCFSRGDLLSTPETTLCELERAPESAPRLPSAVSLVSFLGLFSPLLLLLLRFVSYSLLFCLGLGFFLFSEKWSTVETVL